MTKFEELRSEYREIENKIKEKEDELAKKGISFDEMIEITKPDRLKLFELSKDMRLNQDPTIQIKKKWKGNFFSMDMFIKLSNEKQLTDEDGYGLYASASAVSDIKIFPSDILAQKYRTDFNRVLWFEYSPETENYM